MRRSILLAIFVFSFGDLAVAKTIFQIDLRGSAHVLSGDRPIQRANVVLFHRYPDGLFASVPAAEVVRIVTTVVPDIDVRHKGETIVLGPTGGHGSDLITPESSAAAPPADAWRPYGPMNPAYYYGYGGAPRRMNLVPGGSALGSPLIAPNGFPANPGASPPVIGPNGFPTLGIPSPPPAIGPNGFPVPSNGSRRFP